MRVVHIELFEQGSVFHKSTIMNTAEGICEAIRLLVNSGQFEKMTVEFYDTNTQNGSTKT